MTKCNFILRKAPSVPGSGQDALQEPSITAYHCNGEGREHRGSKICGFCHLWVLPTADVKVSAEEAWTVSSLGWFHS